jgi:[protein-PII] uridylyltransferase
MHYVGLAMDGTPTVDIRPEPSLQTSALTVCARDSQGLLARILGVIYACDLSVLSIRAYTTSEPNAVAIDELQVSLQGKPVPAGTARLLESSLNQVLSGATTVEAIMRQRGKDPDRHQEYLKISYVEGSVGVLEINAPRGRGMPFRIARSLSQHGWSVQGARVGQWAGRGAATFYIVGSEGSAIPKADIEGVFRSRE